MVNDLVTLAGLLGYEDVHRHRGQEKEHSSARWSLPPPPARPFGCVDAALPMVVSSQWVVGVKSVGSGGLLTGGAWA